MAQHVRIVGILHIALGCFGVLAALALFALFGGVAGFLSMNPDAAGDVAFASPMIALIGTAITFFILIMSAPGIIVGIGLIRFRRWARVAGIVVSALDLLHIP